MSHDYTATSVVVTGAAADVWRFLERIGVAREVRPGPANIASVTPDWEAILPIPAAEKFFGNDDEYIWNVWGYKHTDPWTATVKETGDGLLEASVGTRVKWGCMNGLATEVAGLFPELGVRLSGARYHTWRNNLEPENWFTRIGFEVPPGGAPHIVNQPDWPFGAPRPDLPSVAALYTHYDGPGVHWRPGHTGQRSWIADGTLVRDPEPLTYWASSPNGVYRERWLEEGGRQGADRVRELSFSPKDEQGLPTGEWTLLGRVVPDGKQGHDAMLAVRTRVRGMADEHEAALVASCGVGPGPGR